jgi:hypothetical protein
MFSVCTAGSQHAWPGWGAVPAADVVLQARKHALTGGISNDNTLLLYFAAVCLSTQPGSVSAGEGAALLLLL